MRISAVWYWDRASEIWPNWRDGFKAAWEEIAKKHEVVWYLDKKIPTRENVGDFLWLWDDSNSSFFQFIDNYKCRKGLSLTTAPQNWDNLKKVDVVFCESQPIYESLRAHGIRAIKAFGTDTDFFYPKEAKKDIEYFYPATFSPWKQNDKLAYFGNKVLMVGTIQPDGREIYEKCKEAGVRIEVGYFPAEKIRDYYWRTKKCVIPAVHGSERTVLECLSMNIPVEVTNSWNHKAQSYLKEFEDSDFESTRDFVLDRYSHKTFASALLKGIENA